MRVEVDRVKCSAHSVCEGLVPNIFHVGEGGVLEIVDGNIDESRLLAVQEAVESCPSTALRLIP
jgi:ferredoxin